MAFLLRPRLGARSSIAFISLLSSVAGCASQRPIMHSDFSCAAGLDAEVFLVRRVRTYGIERDCNSRLAQAERLCFRIFCFRLASLG